MKKIHVIGGGLAGPEAALQAASLGCEVVLSEMRPSRSTEAHQTSDFAELVCSNSLKSESENTAPWLLKQEMRRAGSYLLQAADASAVPAGHALADVAQIAFADTLEYDYVALNSGSSLLLRMMDAALAAERPLRLRIQMRSFDGICRMIEAGLGIGMLPAAAVRPEILAAGLRAVRLTDAWAERTLWIGAKDAEALTPEAARLFEFLAGVPAAG